MLSGQRLLRGVKEACAICCRPDSTPAMEVTVPLPTDRVVKQHSFSVIGVDNADPLLVKSNGENVKTWILLFVCETT